MRHPLEKTSPLTSTLKAGLCVSVALHAVLVFGVKFWWHSPSLPSGTRDREMSISLIAAVDVETALVPPVPAEAPAAPPTENVKPPEPAPVTPPPVPAPEPTVVVTDKPAVAAPTATPPAPTPAAAEPPKQVAIAVPAPAPRANTSPAKAADEPATGTAPPGIRAAPIYRVNPEPPYPAIARRRRQEGLVLLTVIVTPQGRAARVEIKHSSGFPALDDAAKQAVQGWEFQPGRIGLKPVESEIEVPVRFQLSP